MTGRVTFNGASAKRVMLDISVRGEYWVGLCCHSIQYVSSTEVDKHLCIEEIDNDNVCRFIYLYFEFWPLSF